jgi:outer membrane immunogenic protein
MLIFYGTGGLGVARSELSGASEGLAATVTLLGAPAVTTAVGAFGPATVHVTQFGWVAGAGAEYRLFEHLLLRAEYLHYDLGTATFALGSTAINVKTNVDVVRGGISYKF